MQKIHNMKTLISCDIQPIYEGGNKFDMADFVNYMREFDKILYLFNNKYSPSKVDDTQKDVKQMLRDAGADEELMSKIILFEKQYWYFRDVIDSGLVSEEDMITLIKLMVQLNELSAKNIAKDTLQKILKSDIATKKISAGIWKFEYDPKLLNELADWDNSVLVGGLRKQCLAEIELYLKALGINFKENQKYIYG